jgi:hypothetical protein
VRALGSGATLVHRLVPGSYTLVVWMKSDQLGAAVNLTVGSPEPEFREYRAETNIMLTPDWQEYGIDVSIPDDAMPRARAPIHLGLESNDVFLPVSFYIDRLEIFVEDDRPGLRPVQYDAEEQF